jgi:hypothetical protein
LQVAVVAERLTVREHARQQQRDVALHHRQHEDGRQAELPHQLVDEIQIHKET